VGLYAAFRLVVAGFDCVVFEAGDGVAAAMAGWSNVMLFSAVGLNLPQDARAALAAGVSDLPGVDLPGDDEYITGGDFREKALVPLAAWLAASGRCTVRCGSRVVGIARGKLLKGEGIVATGDQRRSGERFRLVFDDCVEGGFSAVIDASGTYAAATALRSGAGGVSAPGEARAEKRGAILRTIPDLRDAAQAARFAGKRVAVLGTGYSAITTLKMLQDVAPASIDWVVRRPAGAAIYKTMKGDPLPQRSALAAFGNGLAALATDAPHVLPSGALMRVRCGASVAAFREAENGAVDLDLELESGDTATVRVDVLLSLVGYRPDAQLHSELHMHACYASDGPIKLAATLLGAAGGDCLAQAAPGAATLLNPEPDFYIVGMKSYGRNSSFLMRVGYEQVDLLVHQLEAAAAKAAEV